MWNRYKSPPSWSCNSSGITLHYHQVMAKERHTVSLIPKHKKLKLWCVTAWPNLFWPFCLKRANLSLCVLNQEVWRVRETKRPWDQRQRRSYYSQPKRQSEWHYRNNSLRHSPSGHSVMACGACTCSEVCPKRGNSRPIQETLILGSEVRNPPAKQ